MSKKSEIMKIWQECFPADSAAWRRMFFDSAYVDDEALVGSDPETGATVASLLLLSYSMTFHGRTPGLAYIYGAGTLRRHRARGHMSRLIRMALREAADRGDTFAALIPASPRLRVYYARFGFETVFFNRPERYTALHRFPFEGNYVNLPADSPLLFPAFESLMAARPCCVQHTRAQFLTLMDDARLSANPFAAVAFADTGLPAAMLWAAPEMAGHVLRVKELLAVTDDAAAAALTALQRQCPDSPLTIMRPPRDSAVGMRGTLMPGGMARVVNAESALRAVAEANPQTSLTLRLTDRLLPENSGIYTMRDGALAVSDLIPASHRRVDLDVTPRVLAALLFSSAPVAAVTGLPAVRPRLSLMLD